MVDELTLRAPGDPAWPIESGASGGDELDAAGLPRPADTWPRRAARRAFRRPQEWLDRPWPAARIVRFVVTVALLGGSSFAALQAVHLDLVLSDNTPTGGDMGAHVMGPAFLRDHLLPNLQLSGWSNYWYAGFPMYRFYMVVPAIAIVILNVVLPYGIAFKLVVISGIVTLPLCCWAFGRLARFRYPMPELFALGGLLFLFDESFSIYGGNVKSTMAGEFSFSIALSLGMLGLGVFARAMETGRHRSWAAILLALSCLSHGIVLIFVAFGTLLLWIVWMDRRRFTYGLAIGITTFLLSAFWVVPFLFDHAYMTDMKYGYRPSGASDSFWDMFFPLATFFDVFITTFAIVGFVASIARRHLNGAWLGICCLFFVAGVYLTRDSLPVIGLLWNPRLLPFVYLLRYLLMMVGVVELALVIARGVRGVRDLPDRSVLRVGTSVAVVMGVSVLAIQLMFFRVMPGAEFTTHNGETVYSWGIGDWRPVSLTATSTDALSDAWSRYNFTGYEDKPAYGEYKGLVDTMAAIGADPSLGCGRALWENNSENGKYGTTMALMLLPHWTDGCIASMEGLFFEASGTTPYHFITTSAMSESSSDPVRQLRYDKNDADKGVPYLQALGVSYVMVFTEAAKREADAQDELTLVRRSGPWNVYTVADSDLVVPLEVQPVVVAERDGDPRERNLELGMSWFQHQDEWAALPADDGPESWQRIEVAPDESRAIDDRVDIVLPTTSIDAVPLDPVTVSDVELGDQDLRFTVDQIGVPVLVRISYFPNWQVEGAEGPYRVAPNLMVVIPTDTEVHLTFERSSLDILAYVLTLVGLASLVIWRRLGDVAFAGDRPRFGALVAPAAGAGAGAVAGSSDPADSNDDDLRWRARFDDPTTPMRGADLDLDLDLDPEPDPDPDPEPDPEPGPEPPSDPSPDAWSDPAADPWSGAPTDPQTDPPTDRPTGPAPGTRADPDEPDRL